MEKMITCGHGKWAIGINEENASVVIHVSHYPVDVRSELGNASSKDLRKIGELFIETADLWEAQYKAAEIMRKREAEARASS